MCTFDLVISNRRWRRKL